MALLLITGVGCSTTLMYKTPSYSGYVADAKFPYKVALSIGRFAPNMPIDTTLGKTYYTRLDFYSTPIGSILVNKTSQAMASTFDTVKRTTLDSEEARQSFARENALDYIVEVNIQHYDHLWKDYDPRKKNVFGQVPGKMGQTFYPIAKVELELLVKKPDGTTVFSKRARCNSKETKFSDEPMGDTKLKAQLQAVCDQTSEAVDCALSELVKSLKF